MVLNFISFTPPPPNLSEYIHIDMFVIYRHGHVCIQMHAYIYEKQKLTLGVFLNDFLTFSLCLFVRFAMISPTEAGDPQFGWSMRLREIFTPTSPGITRGDHCVLVFSMGSGEQIYAPFLAG